MSSFEVNVSGLRAGRNEVLQVYNKLIFARAQLDLYKRALSGCLSSSSYPAIMRSIENASKSLDNQIAHVRKMSSGLKQIADTYTRTESEIAGNNIGGAMAKVVENRKSIVQRLIDGDPIEGAFANKELSGSDELFGIGVAGTIGGSFLGYELSMSRQFGIKYDEDNNIDSMGIGIGVGASGYGLEGHVSGDFGDYHGSVSGKVLSGEAKGEIGASLFKDGKLSPALYAKLKAGGSVLSGEAELRHGSEQFNMHTDAQGELLGAEAEASASIGKITYEDKSGNVKSGYGVQAAAGAEAYLAKGEISQGITLFGVKFDVGIDGKAGAVGAKASAQATTGGCSGYIGGSLGLGLGLKFDVDWSGFEIPKIELPNIQWPEVKWPKLDSPSFNLTW